MGVFLRKISISQLSTPLEIFHRWIMSALSEHCSPLEQVWELICGNSGTRICATCVWNSWHTNLSLGLCIDSRVGWLIYTKCLLDSYPSHFYPSIYHFQCWCRERSLKCKLPWMTNASPEQGWKNHKAYGGYRSPKVVIKRPKPPSFCARWIQENFLLIARY